MAIQPAGEGEPKAKTFQEILRRERAQRRWSQADVAERIGSDPKTVSRWERGLTFPSPYMSQRLSEIYGKSVQELGLVQENTSRLEDIAHTELKTQQAEVLAVAGSVEEDAQSLEEQNEADMAITQRKPKPGKAALLRPDWKSRKWQTGSLGLLALVLLLIILTINGSLTSLVASFTTLSNPYTGKGQLALNNALTANTTADWEVNSDSIGGCFFQDSSYHITVIKPGGYVKFCVGTKTFFSDFTYEVQMQVIAGDCGGLVFRNTSALLYYFLVCQDGNYRFVRYDRDNKANRVIITSGVSVLIHHGLNHTNVLAVVANGDTFTLYINHIRLYQGTDEAYLDGQIGLLAHPCRIVYLDQRPDLCANPPVEVVFNEARVWTV